MLKAYHRPKKPPTFNVSSNDFFSSFANTEILSVTTLAFVLKICVDLRDLKWCKLNFARFGGARARPHVILNEIVKTNVKKIIHCSISLTSVDYCVDKTIKK